MKIYREVKEDVATHAVVGILEGNVEDYAAVSPIEITEEEIYNIIASTIFTEREMYTEDMVVCDGDRHEAAQAILQLLNGTER